MRLKFFLLTGLFTAGMAVAKPPAGFGTPDTEILLGTKHGQMRFDQEALAVLPSGKALGFDPSMRRFESCHPSH